MTRRRPVAGVLLGASVMMLGACSGGSSATELTMPETVVEASNPAIESVPETAVETTQATPPPTEVPETTEVPATTAEPAPETTEAPPETTAELTIEEQINRDLALGEEALLATGAEPNSQPARDGLTDYFGGESLFGALAVTDQFADKGWIGRPNPNVPTIAQLASEVEFLNDEQTEAAATVCRIDALIVVEPADLDDANDIIINASITRFLTRVRFELDGQHWKRVENLESLSNTPGATECDV